MANPLKIQIGEKYYDYADDYSAMQTVLFLWNYLYPDGKIDYVGFLARYTALTGQELTDLAERIASLVEMTPNEMNTCCVLVNWHDPIDCKIKLAHLMAVLYYCIGGIENFDYESFGKAVAPLLSPQGGRSGVPTGYN